MVFVSFLGLFPDRSERKSRTKENSESNSSAQRRQELEIHWWRVFQPAVTLLRMPKWCCQEKWGDPQHWGLDPARPKGIPEDSFVKRRNARTDMKHRVWVKEVGEFIKARSTLSRSESRLAQERGAHPRGWVSIFYWQLLTRGWNIYYLGVGAKVWHFVFKSKLTPMCYETAQKGILWDWGGRSHS